MIQQSALSFKTEDSGTEVFYNPARAHGRVLLVDLCSGLRIRRYFDLCSGTGTRSVLVKHSNPLIEVIANDPNPAAFKLINHNASYNRVKLNVLSSRAQDLRLKLKALDLIDVDCFGSNVEILEGILRQLRGQNLKDVFFLLFSSDLRILCGALNRDKLRSRYGAKSPKGPLTNEFGLRILLAKTHSLFKKYGFNICVQFAYHFQHYFQILIRVINGKEQTKISVQKYCPVCSGLGRALSEIKFCQHHRTYDVGPLFRGRIGTRYDGLINRAYTNRADILSAGVEFDYASYCSITKRRMMRFKLLKELNPSLSCSLKNGFLKLKYSGLSRFLRVLSQT